MIAPSKSAFAITIAADIGAANAEARKSLRLLPRESNSRISLDFTDAEYVLQYPIHHVLDGEFGLHQLSF